MYNAIKIGRHLGKTPRGGMRSFLVDKITTHGRIQENTLRLFGKLIVPPLILSVPISRLVKNKCLERSNFNRATTCSLVFIYTPSTYVTCSRITFNYIKTTLFFMIWILSRLSCTKSFYFCVLLKRVTVFFLEPASLIERLSLQWKCCC